MSILVDQSTTFIIQGITGREAVSMTRECLDYGANVVGGVTPGRGGRDVHGVPVYDKSYENIEFVEKVSSSPHLFVGPFQTEATAQSFVSAIPSILRKQIDEDQRVNLRSARAGYAVRLSPEEKTGLYDVNVVRVLSNKVTGSFTNLPPAPKTKV